MAEEIKKAFHIQVAEKLIEQLKQGAAPWQKPWEPGEPSSYIPHNPTTGKRYRGLNAVQLLSEGRADPRWMTYKQAQAEGAQVRKGEKGTPIQYWKFTEEQPKLDEQGKPVIDPEGNPVKVEVRLDRPRGFSAIVFNAEQIEGLPPLQRKDQAWNAVERAEQILKASRADIRHGAQDRAFYRPSTDSIHLPDKGQFPSAENYYSTALHELGHWTGHASRLDRDLSHPFGSEGYAREELRAEIASLMLGDELGIGHDPGQHAAYVKSWIKALQEDPMEIFRAAADAEKVQGYVLAFEQQQVLEQNQEDSLVQSLEWNPENLVQRVWHWMDGDSRLAAPVIEALNEGRPDQALELLDNLSAPYLVGWDKGKQELRDAIANEWRQWQQANFLGPSVTPEGKRSFESIPRDLSQLNQRQQQDEGFIQAVEAAHERERQVENDPNRSEEDAMLAEAQSQTAEELAVRETEREERREQTEAVQAREAKERLYLDVPYKQKEEAKALGARWDRQELAWYVPPTLDPAPFSRWEKARADAEASPTEHTHEPKRRQYLAVPYGERNAAKALGAKWDQQSKSWYAGPNADMDKLKRWLPENIPGKEGPALSPREEFAEALLSLGAVVGGEHPVMDGRKHRIEVEGDKHGEKAGFYVGHLDGHPAGYLKNNRTGIEMTWKSKGYSLDEGQKARLAAEAAEKLEARAIEQERLHEQTAQRIGRQLDRLIPATEPTPYLQAKGIPPQPGVYTDRDGQKTYVPAYDADGKLWTMQYIDEAGKKRFAKDSRKEGTFHAIGGLEALAKAPALVIGEGYATASTLSEALGFATVAAFDSGNLPAVAKALHEKYPDKPVIIAGDNDLHLEQTQGINPGRKKAEEAAQATGGKAIFPIFAPGEQTGAPKAFTDFNDLANKSALGKAGVERQVKTAVSAAIEHRQELAKQQRQEQQQASQGRSVRIRG